MLKDLGAFLYIFRSQLLGILLWAAVTIVFLSWVTPAKSSEQKGSGNVYLITASEYAKSNYDMTKIDDYVGEPQANSGLSSWTNSRGQKMWSTAPLLFRENPPKSAK